MDEVCYWGMNRTGRERLHVAGGREDCPWICRG